MSGQPGSFEHDMEWNEISGRQLTYAQSVYHNGHPLLRTLLSLFRYEESDALQVCCFTKGIFCNPEEVRRS